MFTLISWLFQMICLFGYWSIASFLRSLCFWRKVPKSRRLTHSASNSDYQRF